MKYFKVVRHPVRGKSSRLLAVWSLTTPEREIEMDDRGQKQDIGEMSS